MLRIMALHSFKANLSHLRLALRRRPSLKVLPLFLVISLIPFGYGFTPYGQKAAVMSLIVIAYSCIGIGYFQLCHATFAHRARVRRCFLRTIESFYALPLAWLLSMLGLWAFGLCAYTSLSVFYGWPTVPDSIAQYAHARLLSQGYLTAPALPFPEFFPSDLAMQENGKWFSQYPLGHLLLLAGGHVLGAPWLINPLLGACTVAAVYLLAREVFQDARLARLSALLTSFCPLMLFMASEAMNHATALFFITLFMGSFLRAFRRESFAWAVLAGISLGACFITRPLTAVALSLPFIGLGLARLYENRRYWRLILVMLMAFLAPFSAQLYLNDITTGDPLVFAYMRNPIQLAYYRYGFSDWIASAEALMRPNVNTPMKALGHVSNDLINFNLQLFRWAFPGLAFFMVALCLGMKRRPIRLMLASILSLVVAYMPYSYQSWCFGPRFMHELLGPLLVLTAWGILRTPACLRMVFGTRIRLREIRFQLPLFILCVAMLGLPAWHTSFSRMMDNCWQLTEIDPAVIDRHFPDHALVFMNLNGNYNKMRSFYPYFPNSRVIYAKDLGMEKNRQLMEYYADRAVFLAEENGRVTRLR